MNNSNSKQKKKNTINYIYAALIGLLIVACAVTIGLVSSAKPRANMNVGGDDIAVANTVYVVPMKNAVVEKDYSGKVLQYNDTLKQWEVHKAVDFKPSENLDVMAVSDGTVSNVYSNYLEGTVVAISHSGGVVSTYKSLDKNSVTVKVGDKVTTGTVIGKAGDSMAQELNSGAHLHFEMSKNGVKVDPNDYLALGDK